MEPIMIFPIGPRSWNKISIVDQKKWAHKIWTKLCDPHTTNRLNYDNGIRSGWEILSHAFYKRLKRMLSC